MPLHNVSYTRIVLHTVNVIAVSMSGVTTLVTTVAAGRFASRLLFKVFLFCITIYTYALDYVIQFISAEWIWRHSANANSSALATGKNNRLIVERRPK